MMKKDLWQRARFTPCKPLGEDGRLVTACEAHVNLAREIAQEGIVLAKNNGVLPLKKGQKIAVFGTAQIDYVRGGTGSGQVFTTFEKTPYEGLMEKDAEGKIELFKPLSEYYVEDVEAQRQKAENDNFTMRKGITPTGEVQVTSRDFFVGRCAENVVPAALLQQAADFTDTALICLSRGSGEFFDRTNTKGDFQLSDDEVALIDSVKANFKNIVVILNMGGQMESAWLKDDAISAVVVPWTAGMMGGFALADVLVGDVNPSGKLTDTIAGVYEDYPSHTTFEESPDFVRYEEDIFVGYRYFETIPGAAEKVVFPFGFGLSYTTFSRKVLSAGEANGEITVTVEVKNTGDMAGKEVVQVYHGAPQGKLGKALKTLVAFQKTKLLAPGESELVTLSFKVDDMASYDDTGIWQKSAYILEQGEYPVYVGNSIRDVEVCCTYTVAEEFRLVKQLTERCPAIAVLRRLKADGTFAEVPVGVLRSEEYVDYPAIPVNKSLQAKSFLDVAEGKITLDEFIAQFDRNELPTLLGGVPNTGCAQTMGFGGNTKFGIPAVMTSDGPAGVRVKRQSGVRTTAFPGEVLVACTWDPELSYAMGKAIALEVKENNMYAWLAPAMNIHRDPLGGRNFEYYSEDPVISGKFAAAAVRGAQEQRISACPKHLAANNKEWNRRDSDSRLTERALREIYLRGFEICIKESNPRTIMTSYNYINGRRASESCDLLVHILRKEWGFDGLVMTDWSNHGRHAMETKAGNDLKMSKGDCQQVTRFIADGTVTMGQAQECARNVLKTILWYEGIEV